MPEPPSGIGPRRPKVAITIADDNGFRTNLGMFPASERYFDGSNDFPRPLGHVTSVAIAGRHAYVGTGLHTGTEHAEVEVFALDGAHLRTIRLERARRPVTRRELSRFVSEQMALRRGQANEASLRRLYSEIEYPSYYPAYGRLLTDSNDNLWVEDFPTPGSSKRRWSVYSPDGNAVADVITPSSFRLLEAGSDYVLGVWRDALDVPFVHVYSLSKSEVR